MFNTHHKQKILALIFNFIIILLECIGFYLSINKYNQLYFKYYTENCNILTLFSSILFVVFSSISIINKNRPVPIWIKSLRYIATCSLLLTFIIVLFTISPTIDDNIIDAMLSDSFLFHHFLCPIFSAISFVFFENCDEFTKKDTRIACSFTLIYGFVITILNLCRKIKGPYHFLYLYEQPIYLSIFYYMLIISFAYIIAKLLLTCNSYTFKSLSKICNKKSH